MSIIDHSTDRAVVYQCRRGNRTQVFLRADLEDPATLARLQALLPPAVRLVYSDPPWNPGNASYWRTHAGMNPCPSYDHFLDSWCGVAAECMRRSASDVFTEQSANERHYNMFLEAVRRQPGWSLPLLERWAVYYGTPGNASVRRPNALLHFGCTPLATDPAGMAGEPMTIRVCAGVGAPPGSWVVDPCVGKGMTSRMAHYFDWNCAGVEINPKRLTATLSWLQRQGYEVSHEEK